MTSAASSQTPAVNLDNCADEPIHIPGSIQPNGALLAFDFGAALLAWSTRAGELLGIAPVIGATISSLSLPADVIALVNDCIDSLDEGEAPASALEVELLDRHFDCIVHAYGQRIVVEFEAREESSDTVAMFALKAHAAIDRLKRQKNIDALLAMAVDQVRAITGFDRVMAYRFHEDDSGNVVAEARHEALEPYLGRRYPASDIPAQARRLYVLNTLRLISNVAYQPEPLIGRDGEAPLDMSYCVLRSVSPIHIEYLQNMGVGASMSVSIVVNGALWGLIACHHMGAKRVPYSIRMAVDVLAQVLAATVQSIQTRDRARVIEQAAEIRMQIMNTMMHSDDVPVALLPHAQDLASCLEAQALLVLQHGKVTVHGEVSAEQAALMIATLPDQGNELIERSRLADWPEAVRDQLGGWVGALALPFDPSTGGWLVALRQEQVKLLRWAGRPDKDIAHGPNGPRLTPRGSFDEWREIVQGTAERWSGTHLIVARQLLAEMHKNSMTKHIETDRARTHLLAMLGHDLRGPLHSISMAATVLEHTGTGGMLGPRIQASSSRMGRLISQVLDMSRINGGIGLGVTKQPADLAAIVRDLVEESRVSHPNVEVIVDLPATLTAQVDADRFAQALQNVLSNARHHGDNGHPVHITSAAAEAALHVEVRNVARPIAPEIEATLYSALKHTSIGNVRNRGGLGLGLHIAHRIMHEHEGQLAYRYEDPHVVFIMTLPV